MDAVAFFLLLAKRKKRKLYPITMLRLKNLVTNVKKSYLKQVLG